MAEVENTNTGSVGFLQEPRGEYYEAKVQEVCSAFEFPQKIQVMSIKAVGIAIKLTLEGISQIWYPETWFFVMVASICVVMQMIYLNKALDTFNAAIVSPIYYVMFTTLTIVASAIMFKDWYGQSTDSIASEICGFITVLTGTVILHATREEEEASSGRMRWQDSGKSFDEEHLTSLYSPEY